MSRLNPELIAFALALATGCDVEHKAAVNQTGDSASAASGSGQGAVSSSATAAQSSVSNPAQTGCSAIAQQLRSAAIAAGGRSSAVTSPRDTTDILRDAPEAACVVAWRDSTARGLPLKEVYARLERTGWQRRGGLVDASGPGSEALAFSRAGAACVVYGEADVEDDADSTYVPKPGFTITVTCFRDRPDGK